MPRIEFPADQSDCGPDSGRVIPIIDRNRCEAKADCIQVCPFDVFQLLAVTPSDRGELSFIGKLKLRAHGGKQAYAVNIDACHGCGRCVKVCPEEAISLQNSRRP